MSNYAGAHVDFLDRESGNRKKVACYPITRVLLLDHEAKPQQCFVVDDAGCWVDDPDELNKALVLYADCFSGIEDV